MGASRCVGSTRLDKIKIRKLVPESPDMALRRLALESMER